MTIIKPQPNEIVCNSLAEDRNMCSQVLKICWKNECGLVTSDYPMLKLANIDFESINDVKWMTVPHHGSKYMWSSEVLKRFANLETVYISVGLENNYGHPDASVIEELIEYDLTIKRTDREGDLVINREE